MRNALRDQARRRGLAASLLISALWYGAWLAAAGLCVAVPQMVGTEQIEQALPGLLFIALAYWQLSPLITLSLGVSIDMRKLAFYPAQTPTLFAVECLLRLWTGVEIALVLAGLGAGLLLAGTAAAVESQRRLRPVHPLQRTAVGRDEEPGRTHLPPTLSARDRPHPDGHLHRGASDPTLLAHRPKAGRRRGPESQHAAALDHARRSDRLRGHRAGRDARVGPAGVVGRRGRGLRLPHVPLELSARGGARRRLGTFEPRDSRRGKTSGRDARPIVPRPSRRPGGERDPLPVAQPALPPALLHGLHLRRHRLGADHSAHFGPLRRLDAPRDVDRHLAVLVPAAGAGAVPQPFRLRPRRGALLLLDARLVSPKCCSPRIWPRRPTACSRSC